MAEVKTAPTQKQEVAHEAKAEHAPAVELPGFVEAALSDLAQHLTGDDYVHVPRGNVKAAKEALKEYGHLARERIWLQKRSEVEDVLRERPDLINAMQVSDYFANCPVGNLLFVYNTDAPRDDVHTVVEELGEDFKFIELAVVDNLDPEVTEREAPDPDDPEVKHQIRDVFLPVDPICEAIAAHSEKGVMTHVIGQIGHAGYGDAVTSLVKDPLLGSAPGRDSVQVFIDRICRVNNDPNVVTARSPLGAVLGRRLLLDSAVHVAEPLDGHRDHHGLGAAGGLKGGVQVTAVPGSGREFREEQRATLATHGINTLRRWKGVGDAVVVVNRSLQEGKDGYYHWASTARLRNMVQAIFHETCEHEVRGEGKRGAGALENVKGLMNTFLANLKNEGWLRSGGVEIDYESLTVTITVCFKPMRPVDSIVLEWTAPADSQDS